MPNTRAAGQYSSLTSDLKNNLNNYPSDVTIFKEFVQNADQSCWPVFLFDQGFEEQPQ